MGQKIRIGKIVNTQGLKGHIRVYPLTDYKERLEEVEYIYIENEKDTKFMIENIWYKNNLVILKLESFNNINDVERFKNRNIYIDESQLRELPEDTYYIFELVGLEVYDLEDKYIGKIIDVLKQSAQDIYVIEYNTNESKKTFMLPAVKEFVKSIDLEKNKVKIKLIEGMIL